jgi:RNA polymerase sigma factor (sigma-70 family)
MTFLVDNPDILVAYKRGDQKAMEAVYHAYLAKVSRVIRHGFLLSRDRDVSVPGVRDAETECDLIQETFLRAFSDTARKNYNGRSPFTPYIVRIAKNLMIDRYRKPKRESLESELKAKDEEFDLDEGPVAEQLLLDEDPAMAAHHSSQQEACLEYVETLGDLEDSFYELRYRKALPLLEVARQMGISRRQARTMENNLRKGLCSFLKEKNLWP